MDVGTIIAILVAVVVLAGGKQWLDYGDRRCRRLYDEEEQAKKEQK